MDAVLTDIQMFEVSGLELARWIQANRRETRVVILSWCGETEYVHAVIQSKAVGFLGKPALKDATVRVLKRYEKAERAEGRSLFPAIV